MLIELLRVAHIAVLGYWLGSELVINSTFRYVCWAADMPFPERSRLMDHVMEVDQHVRYALVLQAGLGTMLACLLGYLPGGDRGAQVAALLAVAWLVLVEATHRARNRPFGRELARIDRGSRYLLMAALAVVAGAGLAGIATLPAWLALKLLAFAAVMACGVGIRFALIRFFTAWASIRADGTNPALEATVRGIYVRATGILVLLWVFIAVVVALSVLRPGA